jgi:hypothetical protein
MNQTSGNPSDQGKSVAAMVSRWPLVIILVELIAGAVVYIVGLWFVAHWLIPNLWFTPNRGIMIWYVGLRVAVVLNALGAVLAAVSILGAYLHKSGYLVPILGLLLNLVALAVAWRWYRSLESLVSKLQ